MGSSSTNYHCMTCLYITPGSFFSGGVPGKVVKSLKAQNVTCFKWAKSWWFVCCIKFKPQGAKPAFLKTKCIHKWNHSFTVVSTGNRILYKSFKNVATGFAAYSARLVQLFFLFHLRNVFSTPPPPPPGKKKKQKLERQVSKTRKPEAGRIEVWLFKGKALKQLVVPLDFYSTFSEADSATCWETMWPNKNATNAIISFNMDEFFKF